MPPSTHPETKAIPGGKPLLSEFAADPDMRELIELFVQGKVKPHIHATYPLARTAEALNEVLYKRVSGKIVLVTE